MTTLLEARTELQARGFDEIPPARLTAILNVAKNQFEDAYPFPWLEATTSGAAPKTIADLKTVLYVIDTSNRIELLGAPASQVIAMMDTVVSTAGSPQVWWLDGANIVTTWPLSTSAQLTVRYLKESPELSADADTPLIPVRYHPTWIDLAHVRCYLDGDNLDAAAQLRAVVSQDLGVIIARYETRNRQNAMTQTIRAGADDW